MRRNVRRLVLLGLAAALIAALMITDRVQDHETPSGATGQPSSQPVTPAGTPANATPTGERSPGVPATGSPTPSETPVAPHGEHRQPSPGPVVAVAGPYLRLFFDKHAPDSQWRAGLRMLSTASHGTTIGGVPRSAVPALTVGQVTVIRLASGAATVRAVLSDKSSLDVGLVLDETGWKVSRVVPHTPVVTR